MEEAIIRGVAHDVSEAKVTVHGVPDQPGLAAQLFEPLAAAGISVDMRGPGHPGRAVLRSGPGDGRARDCGDDVLRSARFP